ncbi:MAG: hypothetical protein Q9178_003142 [Gyalolechia marmorata]
MLGSNNCLARTLIGPVNLEEARTMYIEASVRNGALEDLEKYAVGPPVGTIRAVGSVIQPAKSGRTKFTTEDDHELIDWVTRVEQTGGSTSGNEIYKQLEAKVRGEHHRYLEKHTDLSTLQNPRHTWQSWRDRWVKTLKILPRSAFASQDAPPTPPADQSVEANRSPRVTKREKMGRIRFTQEDAKALLNHGDDIEALEPHNKQQAWSKWANSYDHPEDHSAEEWQDLWERTIRPIFLKQESQRVQEPAVDQGSVDADAEPHGDPEEQEQASRPVSIPPADEAARMSTVPRSPSYHPESPTRQYQVPVPDRGSPSCVINLTDGANDGIHGSISPAKRKRPAFEDEEEVPSSSPPQSGLSSKRLRRDSVRPEILSPRVPAKEIPDTYATDKPGAPAVIVISDENDSPSSEEEDAYSEASHSLSPELGSSPKPMFSNPDHNMSRTQAAFLESAPPIDLGIPAPDGGWSDEGEDKRDDKSNSEQDHEPELAEEEATEFDLPAPEGGWPDEDAEDNSQGSADGKTEYDRILEEEGGGVYEDENEGEGEVEDGVVVDADSQIDEITGTESSMHTQEKIVAKAMGMRAPSSPTTVRSPSPAPAPAPARFQPTAPGSALTTPTKEPDLFLSEPDGGWDNILSSPPVSPSATQPANQSPSTKKQQQQAPQDPEPNPAANLDAFIAYLLTQNHTEENILLALRCTNFDSRLTEKALVYMKTHPGEIPPDTRGCWTEHDDGSLRGNNASEIRALERKHGKESLEVRWMVLQCLDST